MMAEHQQLDSCPFCGADVFRIFHEKHVGTYRVVCRSCGAHGPDECPQGAAVASWNKRHRPALTLTEIDKSAVEAHQQTIRAQAKRIQELEHKLAEMKQDFGGAF
jgi:Lar family restriction alleviation protein